MELRHTVIVSREKDPLLHAHIASLPFGQIGKEMRALMNLGLKAILQERINEDIQTLAVQEVAKDVAEQTTRVTVDGHRRPAVIKKVPQETIQQVIERPSPVATKKTIETDASGDSLSADDLARIEELENLSL